MLFTRQLPLCLVLCLLVFSCLKTGEEEKSSDCLAELQERPVTWSGDVLPVIEKHCQSCHGTNPQPPATQNLTVLATVQAYYNPANDTNGPGLMNRLTTNNRRMPPDGSLSACDIEKFRKWQTDGFVP